MRGQRQKKKKKEKQREIVCTNAKNMLKIKEKAEIWAQEICQKQGGNQLKRGTLTPLIMLNVSITHIQYEHD